MYRNEVSFVWFRGMWLVATHFIVDLTTGKQSIRSYDGAFFVGNNITRTMVMWESETPADYEEIVIHAPEPTMRQEDYRLFLRMQEAAERNMRITEAEATRRGTRLFFKASVFILLSGLLAYVIYLDPAL